MRQRRKAYLTTSSKSKLLFIAWWPNAPQIRCPAPILMQLVTDAGVSNLHSRDTRFGSLQDEHKPALV